MKSVNEKLREMLLDYSRAEKSAGGEHLRDEDFIRLIESGLLAEVADSPKSNGRSSVNAEDSGEIAVFRNHLVGCNACLPQFKDFYAFFAPAETGETVTGKNEINAAWQVFAPRIVEKKQKSNFLSRLFPAERKTNYFAAFGWGLATVLLIMTAISFYALRQATNEKNQLAQQLENQKQTSEEKLKLLEASEQNSSIVAGQEKERLEAEKAELQKQIGRMQTEIARVKEERLTFGDMTPPTQGDSPSELAEKPDNSLVAVNTPIYDVFPADSVVRGGEPSPNKLVVPAAAKNVVLILNAAGRADFPVYQAELVNNSGKTIWRGSGLRKDATGNFTLTLSSANLKAGNYRLKLSGKPSGGSLRNVAEYAMTIDIK